MLQWAQAIYTALAQSPWVKQAASDAATTSTDFIHSISAALRQNVFNKTVLADKLHAAKEALLNLFGATEESETPASERRIRRQQFRTQP